MRRKATTFPKISVKRSVLNPDRWVIRGGGKTLSLMNRTEALSIARARRRVVLKHAVRRSKKR